MGKKLVCKSKKSFFKLVIRKTLVVIGVICVASVLEKFNLMTRMGKGSDAMLAVIADHLWESWAASE